MALASGYTQLEYIQSSGTQYINTGFAPKNTSRVIMSFEFTKNDTGAAFMCRDSSNNSNLFGVFNISGTLRSDFGTTKVSFSSSLSPLQKLTIDRNKNVCTIGSETVTNTDATFTSPRPLFLLASNDNGTAAYFGKGKLYSCQIYDNGTLVRDFIPCKNASGTVGLWDDVNSVFYTNAGTGTFIAGEMPKGTHRTLIAGTGYDIKSGRVLIGGTGYDIKKGRTLIDGTGYDIKLGTPLAELAEGTIIKINENGSPVEFYVAKHNYQSNLNGNGRTLVVRKECYSLTTTYSAFSGSPIDVECNGNYLNRLSAVTKAQIATTKFYVNTDYSSPNLQVLQRAVFILSSGEFGEQLGSYSVYDGQTLPIVSTLKVAKYNGAVCDQWLRTPTTSVAYSVLYVDTVGNIYGTRYYDSERKGNRPAFTLPNTAEIDRDLILIEP